MQLSGEEHFSQAQSEIWARLTDAEFLAKCLPEVESVQRDAAGLVVCRVRPGVSFLRGTVQVTLDIFDQQMPDSVRIRVHSKGIGSLAIVETAVELSAADTGTQLTWKAEIKELGGLLKPVSRGLITATSQKVIAAGWIEFRNSLTNHLS